MFLFNIIKYQVSNSSILVFYSIKCTQKNLPNVRFFSRRVAVSSFKATANQGS